MSKFGIVILVLPIALLAVGILMGRIQAGRAFASGSAVFTAGFLIYALSLPAATHDPGYAISGFFTGMALMAFSPWAAVALGYVLSAPVRRSPARRIAQAYDDLDDHRKAKVSKAACMAARLAARQGARHLHAKGYGALGDFLHGATKLF